jgi:hypothetical protein
VERQYIQWPRKFRGLPCSQGTVQVLNLPIKTLPICIPIATTRKHYIGKSGAKMTHQNYRKNLSPRHNDPGALQAATSNRRTRLSTRQFPHTPQTLMARIIHPSRGGRKRRGEGKGGHLNRAGHGPRRRGSRAPRRPHGSTASERRRRRGDGRLPEPSGDPHALQEESFLGLAVAAESFPQAASCCFSDFQAPPASGSSPPAGEGPSAERESVV